MLKKIITCGLLAGVLLFIVSYGGLFLSIKFFPSFFVAYNNPLFNSDGSRDAFFYSHAFVISFSLSWFWERFKSLIRGNMVLRGLEFGIIFSLVAMLPVMWITYSALDVTLVMIGSWFAYGALQATIAGMLFAKINP